MLACTGTHHTCWGIVPTWVRHIAVLANDEGVVGGLTLHELCRLPELLDIWVAIVQHVLQIHKDLMPELPWPKVPCSVPGLLAWPGML